MKTKSIVMATLAVLAILSMLNPQLFAAVPLGTVFTYQGRLNDGASPANGFYDLQFTLHDTAGGGGQIGPLVSTNAVAVSNGLFMVTLDFQPGAFNGDARWLAIAVKTNGAPTYTPLTPRQPLTPAPHALFAASAGQASVAGSATVATTAGVAGSVTPNAVDNPGLQDGSVTAVKIAGNQVVKSLNGLHDDVTLAQGDNLTLTRSGQNLTLATPTDWHATGNAGTTPGTHFLGTTDNQPLVLKANNRKGRPRVSSGRTSANARGLSV